MTNNIRYIWSLLGCFCKNLNTFIDSFFAQCKLLPSAYVGWANICTQLGPISSVLIHLFLPLFLLHVYFCDYMNILKARTLTKVEKVEWRGSQTHNWHENYIKIIYFNAFFVITRWGKNSFPLMIPSCARTLLVNSARMRDPAPTHMVISLILPFVVCERCLLSTPCRIICICFCICVCIWISVSESLVSVRCIMEPKDTAFALLVRRRVGDLQLNKD